MKGCVTYALYVTALASAIGLLAPFHWAFDLFNHFRLHAIGASILLCIAAAFLDKTLRRRAVALLLFNVTLAAVPLYRSGGISSLPRDVASDRLVTLVSSNVYTANTQYAQAMDVLTAENPDIIVLTEPNARWIEALGVLTKTYPHTLTHPRADNFGMAIYSKLPFAGEIVAIGDYALPLALLEFKDFRLIVAHPIPPLSSTNAQENRAYLAAIAASTRKSAKPVVVAGDFNSTLWSEATKPLLDAGLKRTNPWGIAYSWPTHTPLLAMQIDHIFATGITRARFKVLPFIGSDHYPVQATLQLP